MATDGGQPWRDRSCYLPLYSCHLQPKLLKSLNATDTKHTIPEERASVWIFCPSSLKRSRNGNPTNPFASNSSNSTPRWRRRKPNAIRVWGMPSAAVTSSRKLQPNDYPGGTHSLSDVLKLSFSQWKWCPDI